MVCLPAGTRCWWWWCVDTALTRTRHCRHALPCITPRACGMCVDTHRTHHVRLNRQACLYLCTSHAHKVPCVSTCSHHMHTNCRVSLLVDSTCSQATLITMASVTMAHFPKTRFVHHALQASVCSPSMALFPSAHLPVHSFGLFLTSAACCRVRTCVCGCAHAGPAHHGSDAAYRGGPGIRTRDFCRQQTRRELDFQSMAVHHLHYAVICLLRQQACAHI